MPASSTRPQWTVSCWPVTVLLMLTVVAYSNTFGNAFAYDDFHMVVNNQSIRDLSNLKFIFIGQLFRPLVNLSYAVDYALWGTHVAGYHATNLILHLMVVVLLMRLFARIWRDFALPPGPWSNLLIFSVTLIYAVHPLLTEAVGYVSGRSELLCAAFFLSSFHCCQRARQNGRWSWMLAGAGLWIAALGCKETASTLPFVLILYQWLLPKTDQATPRVTNHLYLTLAALALLGGLIRLAFYAGRTPDGIGTLLLHNWLTQMVVIWRYIGLYLLPMNQSVMHAVVEAGHGGTAWALIALLALLGLIVLLLYLRRKAPTVTLGGFFFLLLIVPSSFMPLTEAMAEHRTYLAAAGLVLALCSAVAYLMRDHNRLKAATVVFALIGLTLLGLTIARNQVWRTPITLFRDAVAKAPHLYSARQSLADSLRLAGECKAAVFHYRKALSLASGTPTREARNGLGDCLVQLKQYQAARVVFQETLRQNPADIDALLDIGMVSVLTGEIALAKEYLTRVLTLDPKQQKARAVLEALR